MYNPRHVSGLQCESGKAMRRGKTGRVGVRPRRVQGGAARGRALRGPVAGSTRPTSARVRRAIFDILGRRVLDAEFLDAYAGTGAVGIEALSRGARRVVCIENDPAAVKAIRDNRAAGSAGELEVIAADAARTLDHLERSGSRFTIVFLDPPYGDPGLGRAIELAARLVAPGGILVVEHRRGSRLEASPAGGILRGRTYGHGDTELTTFFPPDPDSR